MMPLDFAEIGVAFFIVISGFCIHLGVAKKSARGEGLSADWGGFWFRRIYRLYPPYLAALMFGLFVNGLVRSDAVETWLSPSPFWPDLAAHLAMLHNLSPSYALGAGNYPLWTLGMEEQLYALYFLYLLFKKRLGSWGLLVVLAVTIGWRLAARYALPDRFGQEPLILGRWDLWPFSFWLNWVLGAMAAEAYVGLIRLPAWSYRGSTGLGLGIAGILTSPRLLGRMVTSRRFASLVGRGPWLPLLDLAVVLSPLLIALAGFVFLNRMVRAEVEGRYHPRWGAWPARVGLISYSLYLTHVPVLHILESLTRFDVQFGSIALRYLLFIPACLAFAIAFFLVIESRFLTRPAAGASPPSISPSSLPT